MSSLFFGIPVTLDEAYRIFGINIENVKKEIILKYKYNNPGVYYVIQAHLDKYIYTYLQEKAVKLNVISTDKGQYVIGYRIEEDISPWNRFKNVDDFITLLVDLKKLFYEEMGKCNADLSVVTLEIMEGEHEVVHNPMPYIISF
jgi:hypothetical protein